MPQSYTVPQPLQRDVDIYEFVKQLSKFNHCNITHCTNGSGAISEQLDMVWSETSHDVLFVAFPIVVLGGIALGFLSIIVLARQLKVSNDSYLIGLVIASMLLLSCAGILRYQDYFGHHNTYQYAYGYVKGLNDWLWYSAVWILVVMSLERAMMINQNRVRSVCTAGQAGIVCFLIFCVCLVSALPQFWEYEVVETWDYSKNMTLALSQVSAAAESPEYSVLYYWYTMSICVFIPYPLLIAMCICLMKGMNKSYQNRRRLSVKHNTGSILNKKMTEELHITRLYLVLILLYFIFTGPFTFLCMADHITPHLTWQTDSTLYRGLYDIFEFAFYFYFSVHFLLCVSYSDKFRYSLIRICCCCCDCRYSRHCKRCRKKPEVKKNSDGYTPHYACYSV